MGMMDLKQVRKQGRDESTQEDYPTTERWWERQEDCTTPVASGVE